MPIADKMKKIEAKLPVLIIPISFESNSVFFFCLFRTILRKVAKLIRIIIMLEVIRSKLYTFSKYSVLHDEAIRRSKTFFTLK